METERLYLRRFNVNDLCEFVELIKDKMSGQTADYDDQYPTDDESLKTILSYFAQTDEFFAVVLKQFNRLIGYVALNVVDDKTRNLGICLHSSYHKKGYATEAVASVITYAKDVLKLKALVSGTALLNVSTIKLLERFGFTETSRSEASFKTDENGVPIKFVGCSYKLEL